MIRDDPPTTITGILTGEDPKPFKPRFVRAALRCAFLAAPMLTLLLAIGAYKLDQQYRVIKSFRVQTQFVEQGGALKASPCTPFTAVISCGRITKKLATLS